MSDTEVASLSEIKDVCLVHIRLQQSKFTQIVQKFSANFPARSPKEQMGTVAW